VEILRGWEHHTRRRTGAPGAQVLQTLLEVIEPIKAPVPLARIIKSPAQVMPPTCALGFALGQGLCHLRLTSAIHMPHVGPGCEPEPIHRFGRLGHKVPLFNGLAQNPIGPTHRPIGGLGTAVMETQAMVLGQQLGVFSAVCHQTCTIGRHWVCRWSNQVRHQIHRIALEQIWQHLAEQRAIGVIGLVKVMHLVGRALRHAAFFVACPLSAHALLGQPPLAQRRLDQRAQQGSHAGC